MVDERAWLSVWAKSERDDHNTCVAWLPLYQHLDDAAGVAGLLVDQWVSPQVLARLGAELPDGVDGVRRVACWLAGVHDVGKASPAFAVQVTRLADRMRDFGLVVRPELRADPDRRNVSHSVVGHIAVQDWLSDALGFTRQAAVGWGAVVGSHHGVPPESSQINLVDDRPDLAGAEPWSSIRTFLLERATVRAGGRESLAAYRDTVLSVPAQALLTAIVIMADWIASSDLFPLRPIETLGEDPVEPGEAATAARLANGWRALRLPPQWSPRALDGEPDEVFRDRFARPSGSARPVQVAAMAVAKSLTEPGIVVIEAPMGSGKTEAALLAAEHLAHMSGADGVFVALPTHATSDAMFARVLAWLERLPGRADGTPMSVRLAHGRAHLNETYRGLVRSSHYSQVGEDGEDAVAHWWFSGRKKAGLASFVVGTIDQVLFAGLKSRHLMLRHLGLAGKVVIIDEVHAYDVYMSQYLHRVLHWLGAYRVPVVLLSATLPGDRRAELLRAYDSGRGAAVVSTVYESGYPIVCASGGAAAVTTPLPPERTVVGLDRVADDLDSLVGYLRARLVDGGCAVVVRNTVGRVQETAARLEAEFGTDRVSINHSRFLACDRARNDRDLLRRFGPPEQCADRPDLHIVVASQVVEQSLDIDFDLMVTDLAPLDLVLQRLGRLHRHDRTRPYGVREARCALVGVVDWAGAPVVAVTGSRRVYGDHPLLRAAALLVERDTIALPHDIAPLVHRAYDTAPVGPPRWQPALAAAQHTADEQARARTKAANGFLLGETTAGRSLIGWIHAGVGDCDDTAPGQAQVRDGEESLEVLVVQRDRDGGLVVPEWIPDGGTQLPLDQEVPRQQALVVAATVLRLPPALCHGGVIDTVITELERIGHVHSFDHTPLLKGQLVLPLDQNRQAELGGYQLTYDLRRGLLHERRSVG